MALSFAFLRRPRSRPVDAPGPLSACPTRQALERWVGGQLGSVTHERRVVAIAVELFSATRPLHGLGPRDRTLLEMAEKAMTTWRSSRCATTGGTAGATPSHPSMKRGRRFVTGSGARAQRGAGGSLPLQGHFAALRSPDVNTAIG